VETDEKRKVWLEKHIGGMTYAAIAAEEGVTNWKSVQKGVRKYLDRYHSPTAERWRKLVLARLERLHQAYWEKALVDEDTAMLVLRILERECRLMGLDLTQETPLVQQINQILISYQAAQDWRLQAQEGEEVPGVAPTE
jgi:hypothetical protein